MKLKDFINYYYTLKALRFLLEQSLLSETEYEQVCRYKRRNFPPGEGVHLATLGMDFHPGFW